MLNLPGLQQNVTLAPYTTYQIGGPADYYLRAQSADELAATVRAARRAKISYFILGTGANILIGDKGFRGLVIHNQAAGYKSNGNLLSCESGAVMADLIKTTTAQGLSGLEHFAGIPSSIGGALRQNLHFLAPDRQSTYYIESIVRSAEILDEANKLETVDKAFFEFGYDDSILHHRQLVVLRATFKLTPSSPEAMQKQSEANLVWRQVKQPQLDEYASCGSVFKKIEGVGAGRLIDQACLKGRQVGKAQVSPKHANYLINLGGATAKDVRGLISLIQAEVLKKTGYQLEPEISFIGEF